MPLLRFNAIENGTLVMNGKTFVVRNHQLEVSDTDAEYLLKMPGFSLIEEKQLVSTNTTPVTSAPSTEVQTNSTVEATENSLPKGGSETGVEKEMSTSVSALPPNNDVDILDKAIVSLKRRIHRVPKIVRNEDADTNI